MNCPICDSRRVSAVIDLGELPAVSHAQCKTRQEAWNVQRGRVSLAMCTFCGHLFNTKFCTDDIDYSLGYENSQFSSLVFRAYADRLAEHLLTNYKINDQIIVEIGCGKGEFLNVLCARSKCTGVGFDPSHKTISQVPDENVIFHPKPFDKASAERLHPALVICRHVLEHVGNPVSFLSELNISSGLKGAVVYIEVPNGDHLLDSVSIWDFVYEHFSNFSRTSFELALWMAGFEILDLYTAFDNQFLCGEVRATGLNGQATEVSGLAGSEGARSAHLIAAAMEDQMRKWRNWASALPQDDAATTIWGIGSKGVMFLNLMGLKSPRPIESVIDQSEAKHGYYVPGTGQRIRAPDEEELSRLRRILLMNPIYHSEVRARLDALGSEAELIAINH